VVLADFCREFIKGAAHHQVHRLGCGNPTLKGRRVNDAANLDATGVFSFAKRSTASRRNRAETTTSATAEFRGTL
jgi:hypothetical protein